MRGLELILVDIGEKRCTSWTSFLSVARLTNAEKYIYRQIRVSSSHPGCLLKRHLTQKTEFPGLLTDLNAGFCFEALVLKPEPLWHQYNDIDKYNFNADLFSLVYKREKCFGCFTWVLM